MKPQLRGGGGGGGGLGVGGGVSVVRRVEIIENLMAFFPQRQCKLPVTMRRPYYASVGKAGFYCACIFSFKGALS